MACVRGSIRPFRKRPNGFKASPMSGDARRMHLKRSPSMRDTDSDPLCEPQKEISTFGSSSRANAAAACMYSSGKPVGTENSVASRVSAIASRTINSSQANPTFRSSSAAADQKGGLERESRRLRTASSLGRTNFITGASTRPLHDGIGRYLGIGAQASAGARGDLYLTSLRVRDRNPRADPASSNGVRRMDWCQSIDRYHRAIDSP